MLLYLIKQKMQNYNDIKQLALLYFEGKANCEEEAKVFDFIAESAEQKRMFVQNGRMNGRESTYPTNAQKMRGMNL